MVALAVPTASGAFPHPSTPGARPAARGVVSQDGCAYYWSCCSAPLAAATGPSENRPAVTARKAIEGSRARRRVHPTQLRQMAFAIESLFPARPPKRHRPATLCVVRQRNARTRASAHRTKVASALPRSSRRMAPTMIRASQHRALDRWAHRAGLIMATWMSVLEGGSGKQSANQLTN